MILRFASCFLTLLLLGQPVQAERSVTVFAAASLKGALDSVVAAWPGQAVVSYGGSAAQARQVALGAPADLVILANPDWMDWLAGQGALMPDTRVDLLANSLVLIGPADAPQLPDITAPTLLARLDGGRMAMGQHRSVPAGQYARSWMDNTGLWPVLSPHLAEVENVRLALTLVALAEAPLGVVYATDAQADPRVQVLYAIPPDEHAPIRYPAALSQLGAQSDASAALLSFLSSETAAAIFAAHGFVPLGQPQPQASQ